MSNLVKKAKKGHHFAGYPVVAIATKEIRRTHRHIPVVISVTESCGFGVVCVMFGIPKRVFLLRFQALSEMFSLFLGTDVSVNWGNGVPAV